jgi:hypothetical protein
MVILKTNRDVANVCFERQRYFARITAPSHRDLIQIATWMRGAESIHKFYAQAVQLVPTLNEGEPVYIDFRGGSSHGADLTREEAKRWLFGFCDRLKIKSALIAGHWNKFGRFDFHVLVQNVDSEDQRVKRVGRPLSKYGFTIAQQLTAELNQARIDEGAERFTIASLTEDWDVYFMQKLPPEPNAHKLTWTDQKKAEKSEKLAEEWEKLLSDAEAAAQDRRRLKAGAAGEAPDLAGGSTASAPAETAATTSVPSENLPAGRGEAPPNADAEVKVGEKEGAGTEAVSTPADVPPVPTISADKQAAPAAAFVSSPPLSSGEEKPVALPVNTPPEVSTVVLSSDTVSKEVVGAGVVAVSVPAAREVTVVKADADAPSVQQAHADPHETLASSSKSLAPPANLPVVAPVTASIPSAPATVAAGAGVSLNSFADLRLNPRHGASSPRAPVAALKEKAPFEKPVVAPSIPPLVTTPEESSEEKLRKKKNLEEAEKRRRDEALVTSHRLLMGRWMQLMKDARHAKNQKNTTLPEKTGLRKEFETLVKESGPMIHNSTLMGPLVENRKIFRDEMLDFLGLVSDADLRRLGHVPGRPPISSENCEKIISYLSNNRDVRSYLELTGVILEVFPELNDGREITLSELLAQLVPLDDSPVQSHERECLMTVEMCLELEDEREQKQAKNHER